MSLIDLFENALERDSAELREICITDPGWLLARREHLVESMQTMWASDTTGDLPPRTPGELRPLYADALISGAGVARSRYSNSVQHSRLGRDIRALLLYADSVIVVNPLEPWIDVEDHGFEGIYLRRNDGDVYGSRFTTAVLALLELGELIRSGVVKIVAPPRLEWCSEVDLREPLALAGHRLRANGEIDFIDPSDILSRMSLLLKRFVANSVLSLDEACELFTTPDFSGPSLSALIAELAYVLEDNPTSLPDELRLEQLLELALPGVDRLSATAMVTVRDQDEFGSFRADLRQALAVSEQSLKAGHLETSRREVQEFMTARASELKAATKRTSLREAVGGDLVSWLVGASLSSLAGWKAAILGLLAKGMFDVAGSGPAKGVTARLEHYVALAEAPQHARPPNNDWADLGTFGQTMLPDTHRRRT